MTINIISLDTLPLLRDIMAGLDRQNCSTMITRGYGLVCVCILARSVHSRFEAKKIYR